MWIFGYGSLMWKVDFPYVRKLTGYIKGYKRKFWQLSEDHRGIPNKPGRVVTLISSDRLEEDCVWGICYEIDPAKEDEILKHLDYREKDGYSKVSTLFYPYDKTPQFLITVYVANETNPYFAGSASVDAIARQILTAEGPSGKNTEYLFNLAEVLRKIVPNIKDDEHLFEIEAAVKHLMSCQNKN